MKNWHQERSIRLANEEQARQLAITEATSDLVATIDIDGFLISLNNSGYRLLELDKNEDISKIRLADFYAKDGAHNLVNHEIPKAIKHSVWHSETIVVSSTGDEIHSSQVLIAHSDQHDNISFFSIILRDIRDIKAAEEERKNLQNQLHHSKKMETMGRLAGGIAHDFNNILTVIIGYAELGLLSIENGQSIEDELEIILDSAQKGSRLSSQLLSFSSKHAIEAQVLDLNSVIRSSQQIIESTLGGGVEVSITLDESLWLVKIDLSQLEQIILNLAVNARDALESSTNQSIQRFALQTQNKCFNTKQARRLGLKAAGDYVLFTASDNGCGMNKEVSEHIFEPFFTTKPTSKGTGLGLASVYGAVTQNNGHISVKSSPGKGTTFSIYLPHGSDDLLAPISLESFDENEFVAKSGEKILLVEDNDDVRELLSTVLRDLGYTVLAAENGEKALDIFTSELSNIDLVITDVVMPQLDGLSLSKKLQEIKKDIHILLISGNGDRISSIRAMEDQHNRLLNKPIPTHLLAQEIRSILD